MYTTVKNYRDRLNKWTEFKNWSNIGSESKVPYMIACFKNLLEPFTELASTYEKYTKSKYKGYHNIPYIEMDMFYKTLKPTLIELGEFIMYLQHTDYDFTTYMIPLIEYFASKMSTDKEREYLMLIYQNTRIVSNPFNFLRLPEKISRTVIAHIYHKYMPENFFNLGNDLDDDDLYDDSDDNLNNNKPALISLSTDQLLELNTLKQYFDEINNIGGPVENILLEFITFVPPISSEFSWYSYTYGEKEPILTSEKLKVDYLKQQLNEWKIFFHDISYFCRPYNGSVFYEHPYLDINSLMNKTFPNKETVFEITQYIIDQNPCKVYVLPLIEYLCVKIINEGIHEDDLMGLVKLYSLVQKEEIRKCEYNIGNVKQNDIAKFIDESIQIRLIKFLIESIGFGNEDSYGSEECSFVINLVKCCYNIEMNFAILCNIKSTVLKTSLLLALDSKLDMFIDYLIENISQDTSEDLIHTVKCCLVQNLDSQVIKFTDNGFDISVKNNYLARYAYGQYKHDNQQHMFLLVSQYHEIEKFIKDSCRKDFKYVPTRSCKQWKLSNYY